MKLTILKEVLSYVENYDNYNDDEHTIIEDSLEVEINQITPI